MIFFSYFYCNDENFHYLCSALLDEERTNIVKLTHK